MPELVKTFDDFIAEHGGHPVLAVEPPDSSWTGAPPGTPLANGKMFILPDGAYYRLQDDGSTSWQVPIGPDAAKWRRSYLESAYFALNEEWKKMSAFVWDRFDRTGQEPSKEEARQLKKMKAQGEALRRKLTPKPSPAPAISSEQYEREQQREAARERIAAVMGAPPAEPEIEAITMSLEQGFGFRRMGANIHVRPTPDGKGEATLVLKENPGLATLLLATGAAPTKGKEKSK